MKRLLALALALALGVTATACSDSTSPGASIAALARANGMNTNVLHRWLQEHDRSGAHQLGKRSGSIARRAQSPSPELPAFIALPLPASPPTQTPAIRIEIQRERTTIIINWPVQDGGACAQWLRECVQ